ncbi:MAG: hypothetical protein MJ246_05815 [Clostridia bacterium]|nr:hypothetical protein [Clostridia bacterium]
MKRMKMFKKIGVLALTLLFVLSVSYFGYAKDTTLQKETKYSGNVSWKVVQSGTTYTLTINSSKAEGMPSYNSSNYTSRP